MSKSELTGPKNLMNFPRLLPDHSRGFSHSSSSTLSQSNERQRVSYKRLNGKSWRAVIGKNGRRTEASTIEKIFPKLELAVIFMYLVMFIKAFLPWTIPSSSTFRSFLPWVFQWHLRHSVLGHQRRQEIPARSDCFRLHLLFLKLRFFLQARATIFIPSADISPVISKAFL